MSAQPTGGQVVGGAATFSSAPGALTITQTSGRAIIDWQDFSIGAGALAKFVQPDATSAVLNRVVSALPSTLDGTLQANGRVYLINPNGVLIGAGGRIDAGGFLASTLDVANAEFLAGGDLRFSGDAKAAIKNLGAINALGGEVFLIARQVENAGAITAANGTVGVAAGAEVLLTTGGSERLFVQAASNAGAVVNTGTIDAASAELKAAGGNAYALAINNAGAVRATGVGRRGGAIWLVAGGGDVASTGTLDASSAEGEGGRVEVRGERVALGHDSRIDASGATGGGQIVVFGGSQDGGQVTVDGALDARSRTSGDGGFIETSAASVKVADSARVTTTAVTSGGSGTWLIDPVDFTIAASGGDMTGAAVGTALAGGNFTIQSSTGSSGTAGDVNVNDVVTWSANKLTLNAQNNINFNSALRGSGTASLALEYGQGAVEAGNAGNYLVYAAIDLPSGNNFSTKLGSDGAVTNYTVITSLGVAGDATSAPSTATLQGMAASANLAGNFALGGDIDASPTAAWGRGAGFTPIGNADTSFTGSLAGLGHVVCDPTVNLAGSNAVGLFGVADFGSAIRDLGLLCVTVNGGGSVGALVGYNSGRISNSYVTGDVTGTGSIVGGLVGNNVNGSIRGSYSTATVNGDGAVGGLVGDLSGGTVDNSYATGSVTGTGGSVGGLAGKVDGGTLSNSRATGSVTGLSQVGGLVGVNSDIVINSYATGSVTGTSSALGGLAGNNFGTIDNSYATGAVSDGTDSVGGLVGYNAGAINNTYATGSVTSTGNFIGGLVGDNVGDAGSIGNSYATGSVVSAGTYVGGLIGYNGGAWGVLTNLYWNTDVNPTGIGSDVNVGDSPGASGLTTVELRTAASLAGFNFTTTPGAAGNNWVLVDADGTLNNAGAAAGATYAMLASEYSTTINGSHQLQLVQMAPAASYTLGTNIAAATTGNSKDVWGGAGFVPLGAFTGTFDGRGHTISDLTINRPSSDDVGLFTIIGSPSVFASVSNLGLLNPAITGHGRVGGIVGLNLNGRISDSFVIGGTVTGTTEVGGLAGYNDFQPHAGFIEDSYTSGVTVTGVATVGGLVGYNGPTGHIDNAYSNSTVVGTSNVGELVGGNVGALTHSFWDKTVKAVGIGSDVSIGDTAGATGMTAAELQQQLNFTSSTTANGSTNPAWDFTSNWVMYEGHTAPLLRVFMTPLKVTANSASKTYDGLAYSGGSGVSYFCCPDLSLLFGTVAYGGTSQGAINVGTYGITPSGLYSTQLGYLITNVAGVLTVNKADLTLSGTRAFDGTTLFAAGNLTATGVHGETFSLTGSGASGNLSTKNVQTAQLLASVTGLTLGSSGNGGLTGNYNGLATAGSSVSVTAAPLTASTSDVVKIYDGGTTALGTPIVTAGTLFGTDTLAGGTFAFVGKDVGVGNKTVTVVGIGVNDGNSGLNYAVTQANNTTSTINKADLILTGTRGYDGTTLFAGSHLTANGVNGEWFTVTGAGNATNLATRNVQSNHLLASITGLALGTGNTGAAVSTNYNILTTTGSSVSVTTASLTVSSSDVIKTYDGGTSAAGSPIVTVGTLFGTDVLTGGTFAFTNKDFGLGNKTVSVSGIGVNDGNSGNNYAVTQADNLTSTINKADLTLSGTRTYNGTTLFAGGNLTATGVNSETFTVTGAGDVTNLTTKNVQTSQLLASVTGLAVGTGNSGAAVSTNYNALATTGSSVSVTTANLTVSSADVIKTYDGGTTAVGSPVVMLGTLFGPDVLTGGTFAFSNKDFGLGNKTVSVAGIGVNDGNSGHNYAVIQVDNTTSTINKANLTLSGTRVYDGTTIFAGSLLTATGVNGEFFTVTGAGAVGNLTTRNVQTTQLLGNVTGLAVGTGNSGAAVASNYNVLATTGSSVSVTKASLTVSSLDVVKTYDGGTSANGTAVITVGSLFGSDVLAFNPFGPNFVFVGKDVGVGNKTVTLSGIGVNDGNAGHNYVVTLVDNTTSTINPANLTLSGSRVYDGTTIFAGSLLTATGVNGETFTVTGAGAVGNLTSRNVQSAQLLGSVTGLAVGTGNSGAALASNYNVLATTGSAVTVTPASVTVSSSDVVKTYDGDTTAAGSPIVQVGTLFGSDVLAGGAFAFTNKDFGLGNKTVSVTGIGVNDGNSGHNYTVTQADNTTSTINKANLTLSGTQVFDGTTIFAGSHLTATGVNGETFTVTGAGAVGNLTTRDVQTSQLLASVGGLAVGAGNSGAAVSSNYNSLATTGSSVSVTPASLTITADNKSKVYGASDPTLTATFSGLVPSDDSSVVSGLALSTTTGALASAGAHPIFASGATASNYTINFGNGTLTVTPATVLVTANAQTKIYGNADPALTFVVGPLQYTDTAAGVLSGGLTRVAGETVAGGPYLIGLGTLAANANYTISYTGNALTITPRPITLTPGTTTKVYGAVDPALSVSITGGSLASVTVTDTLAEVTGTLSRQAGPDVGLYDVQLGAGAKAGNYAITFVTDNNAFAITPATLTYVATATSRLIGEPDPAFSGTVTGFVPGETLANATTGTLAFSTTATSASPIGVYPINGSGLTANHGNYIFVQAPPNATAFTIGAATPPPPLDPLTITADNQTKLYGAVLPTFTATYAGFVHGDTSSSVTGLQFNSTATIGSNVGTYTITPFGATAPANYAIDYVTGTLTINPATLTYTATLVTRLVGENNPVFTGTVGGFVNGETQASATTGTLTFNSEATSASPVGTYAINGSGLTANGGNYVFVQAPPNATALTIIPVSTPPALTPLTITADDKSKLYGAPLPTFTASFAGFINADTAASVTGLQFSTTATIGSHVGTYVITPFGATAPGYYTVSYVPGTLTINPATLTYTATPVGRLFGVENPTLTGTVGGFVNGDTATTATTGTATWSTPATTASGAGTYAITGSGLTANHGNYVFVQAPTNASAFTITPVTPLTIKADDKSKLYGDALPTFTATFTGFTGGDTASSVTGLQFNTTATISSNVGLYTITPFGATAPSYYSVSYLPGTLTINAAALTIAANNATKTYGAANPAFTATVAGFKGSDTATVLGGTIAFATPATTGSGVGSYAITASGLTSTNYTLTYAPGTLTINRAALTIVANDATKVFGDANPVFGATFTGLVNGDASSVVTGLVFGTSATTDSAIGNYAIVPSGAAAANYVVTFVNGTLHVTVPSVPVNDTETPVITIDDQPVLTGDYAVVKVGDRFVLVSLARENPGETSVNDRLDQTLGELGGVLKAESNPGGSDFGTFLTHLDLAGFEVLATLGDGSDGSDGLTPGQRAAPGTTRESALNRGKFNVVYRELLAEARVMAGDNLSARSSYNVFLDTDKPQVVIVHTTNSKSHGPSDTPDGKSPANPTLTSLLDGTARPGVRG